MPSYRLGPVGTLQHSRTPSMSPAFKRVLLVLAGVILTTAILELALRILAGPDAFSRPFSPVGAWVVTDPVLGWRNKAGFRHDAFLINSRGFRGPEPTIKPRGSTVVCLGDSGTFGVWVGDKDGRPDFRFDGYPEELRRIGQSYGISQVINAGVIGYTTAAGLRQFITELVAFSPDIVTVRFGTNDHKVTTDLSRRISEPAWRDPFYALTGSRLFRVGLETYRSLPGARSRRTNLRWVAPQEFETNLIRIIEEVRRSGAQILLMDTPLRPLRWGQGRISDSLFLDAGYKSLADFYATHERYQRIQARVASIENVPLLQTQDELSSPRPPLHFGSREFIHPNATGARTLAQLLLEEFGRLGWLDD